MCCSSTAATSPVAEFLKSQSAQELWKASLKPKDPLKPDNPAGQNPADSVNAVQPLQAVKAPGTGLALDITA